MSNSEEIISAAISSLIEEAKSQGKFFIRGMQAEVNNFLKINLRKYLDKHTKRYSYIKTFLKGNNPIYIYDVYFPLQLMYKDKVVSTENVSIISKISRSIIIVGDAGSGKSTLLKHLFLSSIELKIGIPFIIELRDLNNSDGSIENFIKNKLFETKLTHNESILNRLLKSGKFIFFLDGYDELNKDIKADVVKSINTFMLEYSENIFLLTTRPFTNVENLPLFHTFKIAELTKDDIKKFTELQLDGEVELAAKIIKAIEDEPNRILSDFLKNPLLLCLFILTFQSYSRIPAKKFLFYRRVINALFSEHDSKKLGYSREITSGLSQEQFEEILKRFSFISYFDGIYEFDANYVIEKLNLIKKRLTFIVFDNHDLIYDLKLSIALWTEDSGILSFSHRSLQEYFAATFIKRLGPEQKEKVYEKIRSGGDRFQKFTEVYNFLDLCSEIDETDFYKYFYLPILEKTNLSLKDKEGLELVRNVVQMFCEGIEIYKVNVDRKKIIKTFYLVTPESLFEHIYITDELLSNIYNELQLLFKETQINVLELVSKAEFDLLTHQSIIINFEKLCHSRIFDNVELTNLFIKCQEFKNWSLESYDQKLKVVEFKSNMDNEFIEMI